jgi:tetratricopeptide (TPR) repeat protein
LACGLAAASEESERLYSRGLVDFHTERYSDALQLFEQAVQADPEDVYALYYRGVTKGRVGDFRGGASDLRGALAIKPDFDQAALELGIALVQTGEYREAVQWLSRAQQVSTLDPQASLFRGIAELRLGETDRARDDFARAARDPEFRTEARYYEGVADYKQGRWAAAQEHFSYVATTSPESAMGREALVFQERMRGGGRARYQLFGEAGFQYDSNVVLAPLDEALKNAAGISKQADGRAIFSVGGTYAPLLTEHVQLSLGYEFFQSLHFDLTQYNLQNHRPEAQVVVSAGPVRMGVLGTYDYYFIHDGQSFLQGATGLPWVEVPTFDIGRLQLNYRFRWRGFLKHPFDQLLDSVNHAPGARQFVDLGGPGRYVSLDYQFDREEASHVAGRQFAYDGQQIGGSFSWAFDWGATTELGYAYRHERYDADSGGRRDDEHGITVIIEQGITEHLAVVFGYFGTINNSNQRLFRYERHVGSLSLRVRL